MAPGDDPSLGPWEPTDEGPAIASARKYWRVRPQTAEERVRSVAVRGVPAPLAGPIAALRAEHDAVGGLFKRIRTLTRGYTVPDDACNAYRAMLGGLKEMELDLHEHIHKENNVLFPRAVEMERQLAAGASSPA